MAKLTLSDVSNIGGNPTSAQTTINNNSTAIETAMENTLSRDGTAPNTMGADLDMNSNRIINLGEPVNDNDAARLVDLIDLVTEEGVVFASQAQAEAGAATNVVMSPANVDQYVDARIASQAEAEAGTDNEKLMTPLRVRQAVDNGGSYNQGGTGADDRTITSRLQEFVTHGDFGGTGVGDTADRAKATEAFLAAAAAGKPFVVPIFDDGEPMVVQVPEDFDTVQDAHDAMLNWIFPGQQPKFADYPLGNHITQFAVHVSVAAGDHVLVENGIVWNHPAGNQIKVTGRGQEGLTFSSLQVVTYSSGVHLIKIRFSTWPSGNPQVGNAMRIILPTGTGDYRTLEGVWRIHAVDNVNQDITLAVYNREVTTAMTMTLSGGIFIYLPTQIRLTNAPSSGADVGCFDVFTTLHIGGMSLSGNSSGTNASTTCGIILRDGARLFCQQYFGVLEFQRSGLWALNGAKAEINYAGFCGNDTNVNVIQGSMVDGTNCGLQGATSYNLVVNTGSQASIVISGFGGCDDVGIAVLSGSQAVLSGHCDYNDIGVECGDNSLCDLNDMRVQNNTTYALKRSGVASVITGTDFSNVTGTSNPTGGYADQFGGYTGASTGDVPVMCIGSSGAWNPASVANGAQTSTTFAVAGAAVGHVVLCSSNAVLQGLHLWGEVTASNTVTLYLSNNTGGAVDLGAMTVAVKVIPL